MRRLLPLSALSAVFILSACGSGGGESKMSETRMDDLESLNGTISDDMLNTDEATDEAPVDAPPAQAAPSKNVEPKDDPVPGKTEKNESPETVKAEPEPATK